MAKPEPLSERRNGRQARGHKAWHRGLRAEWLAAQYLRLKGYRILAQRLRTPVGEIDLLACKGNHLVFVEVKARSSIEEALSAVTPKASARLMRAALYVQSGRSGWAGLAMRFDVIAIAPWRWPVHCPNVLSETR